MSIDGKAVGISNAKTAIWTLLKGKDWAPVGEVESRFNLEHPNLKHRFHDALHGMIRDGALVVHEDGKMVKRFEDREPMKAHECDRCGRVRHAPFGAPVPKCVCEYTPEAA